MATVLVADDDPNVRFGFTRLFAVAQGHEVIEANGAEMALKLMASVKPDVVVTEALMPTMTVLEYIKALRWAWPHGGIVALSAGGNASKPRVCYRVGKHCGCR